MDRPDTWIPERLSGDDRELASAIWTTSGKTVNSRHTYGHWLLSQKYGLVEEGSDGNLVLTDRGRDFIDNEGGETEAFLDEQEGLAKLLSLVADNGPTRAGGVLEEWTEYINRHSSFASPSTFRDTLRRRLNNLLDRGLLSRKSTMYSVTEPVSPISIESAPKRLSAATSSKNSGRWPRSKKPRYARACASCYSTWTPPPLSTL